MTNEVYTPGTTPNAVSFMARRRAATHAAFFLPELRPGMRVLDVGCGPGSITLDLARAVSPGGGVVGIDRTGEQFDDAVAAARREAIPARFEVGSVYALPFPDASVEAVFSNALFEHLAEPQRALGELRRVLAPGGRIGLRSPDWGGFVLHPESARLDAAIARYEALQRGHGGDTHAGRKLAAWLREAGFVDPTSGGTYEIYPDTTLIGDYLAVQLDRSGATDHAETWRHWARASDAMFAQAWLHAVATRP